ncbi:2-polyprenyl-6-methoxyphenol hydroxylase-like FAD-dependent oxidoreductase [Actinokineospora baliensis]|uniref:FAD-dependent monooxygenase n=1 Tax=Actinokineospora baliensis TaxID=547056 RepID=UPI00195ECD6C|nr:FAD-dependent monooxygenase [Actinokineospora baliensis]MBM7774268.1 2-polyprenyl-6-methoxyphenol hydroxylase-like FAD-dependent oxidoreductase [Actinokineospora baliensis]
MESVRADVVVVGAGPTGLMLANEVALAGVCVVVLERLPERSGQSKALNLQPRTAEVFDLRGLMESTREYALGTWGGGHFGGRPLGYEGWGTRHPYQVHIPQAGVERALEERLGEQGVQVQWGHDVLELAQDDTGVNAVVRTPAGELEVRADYLVGCDGGRSTIRKQLGVDFPGTDASVFSFVADIVLDKMPAAVPTRLRSVRDAIAKSSDRGVGGLIPMGEPGHFRLVFTDLTATPDVQSTPVSEADVLSALRHLYGEEVAVPEVRWASRFTNATRQVANYRVGRVLLAGDAAHIHFPAGGQGLNLGIQDAMNLGWKLAAEVRGTAPEGLLDTYHAERHPVGARVLDNTRAQTLPPRPTPETLAMHRLITQLAELPEANRYLAGMVSGLDIRYAFEGPEHPLLGARLPDIELTTGWASDLFHPGHGVLLTTDDQHAKAAAAWSDRVVTAVVADLGDLGAAAVLVRPDGYVCWLSPLDGAADFDELERTLGVWFGRP